MNQQLHYLPTSGHESGNIRQEVVTEVFMHQKDSGFADHAGMVTAPLHVLAYHVVVVNQLPLGFGLKQLKRCTVQGDKQVC